MKFLLLLIASSAQAQVVMDESIMNHKVITQVVGYTCPANYYYNPPTRLCYPRATKEEPVTVEDKIESRLGRELPTKRLNTDSFTVNIYNNNEGKMTMPAIDVTGEIGVKRKRSLDKQAVLKAVESSLDGDWTEEEKTIDVVDGELYVGE